MSPSEILQSLIAAVEQSQEQSQRSTCDLYGDTVLIGDVPGFDSLAAVELCFILSDCLESILKGREFPESILLGSGRNGRPTLNEIAQKTYDFAYGPKSEPASPKSQSTTLGEETRHLNGKSHTKAGTSKESKRDEIVPNSSASLLTPDSEQFLKENPHD